MSLYDWKKALELRDADVPFHALIMAAVLKADDSNKSLLWAAWPGVFEEVRARYHSRLALNGVPGALPDDMPKQEET